MTQPSRAGRLPRRRAILAGAMAVVFFQGAHRVVTAREGASPAHRPPHLQRGDEVEARHRSYQERLERFFRNLAARLEPEAPDFLAKLREAPPTPVAYGYGILPKLVPARRGRAERGSSRCPNPTGGGGAAPTASSTEISGGSRSSTRGWGSRPGWRPRIDGANGQRWWTSTGRSSPTRS